MKAIQKKYLMYLIIHQTRIHPQDIVLIDQSEIIPNNMTALSFTFSGAEIGALYNYYF